jgi:hypothetical protein
VIGPTPLLDFFKRGEVDRDVRLEAAHGTLTPRAYEQLAILILLVEDPDPEVRNVAAQTLERIPVQSLQQFLARSDVPIGMREFFADRGVFPDEIPRIEAEAPSEAPSEVDEPLIDAGEPDAPDDFEEGAESALQKLTKMSFTERLKAAVKGTKEMRAILVRDTNKMISAAVLSSPKLTENEIEGFARMASVSEDVLRTIGHNRAWMKKYSIVVALTKNPKTPLAMSLTLMSRLSDRDLTQLSVDRNVPEPLRVAARKRVVGSTSGGGKR